MKFKVNDKIPGDVIIARGGQYRKQIVYDPVKMKLPDRIVEKLLSLHMGKMPFFVRIEDGN